MRRNAEGMVELGWKDPELNLIKPNSFSAFYPPALEIPGLKETVQELGGGSVEKVFGYGSTFSGVASRNSLMDMIMIVRNPWVFYNNASQSRIIRLGTTNNPGFHAVYNYEKPSFYLGEMDLGGVKQRVKVGVISHDELLKHARGGRPGVSGGKGGLWLAGRLQKVVIVPLYSETTKEGQQDIDLAINQARIDGALLVEALLPHYFSRRQFAEKYVDLSYLADKRVEKANKSLSLLEKSELDYYRMHSQILERLVECGFLKLVDAKRALYEKEMSLPEGDVRKWLKECAQYARWINFGPNYATMGLRNGAIYGIEKCLRVLEDKMGRSKS